MTANADVAESRPTQEVYLSGTGADDTVAWDFYCTGGRNSGTWTTIPVPSCWELEGFGTYNYGHDADPADEQGRYRHAFNVPSEWQGQNVQIVFEGAMTDTEVKINGVSAGAVHQGAFYQFRYDISDLLNYGESNLLEVTVSKRSSNDSINLAERAADYWIFGGIFRPVLLEVRPAQALQRIAIDAQADGAVTVIAHAGNIDEALTVQAHVENAQGQQVGEIFSASIQSGGETATLAESFNGITPWTMEAPALYEMVVELRRGEETLHTVRERFGFRTVEVRAGDGLYLNGTKIRVKGIDRHVFHPDYGRTSCRAFSEEAVALIKGLNMNAIRMSHYPPDQHMLDVCDEEGLLVIDELTGWQSPSYDTPTAERIVREIVERDVNHPSIIFWANGNEGGWNTDVDDDWDLYDPQHRPVIHPSSNWRDFRGVVDLDFGGIDTTHYQNYASLLSKLNGPTLYMPTEFLHGLYDGGHAAGLQDYWNAMHDSPYGVGGFLWVFADEGVRRTDLDGLIDNDGNHAPDGLVGPYNEKEPSYYAVRDIWSPILLGEPALTSAGWDGTVGVTNDYYFTDLSECTLSWTLGNLPVISDSETGFVVAGEGELSFPSIAPQGNGSVQIPLPDGWYASDVLQLAVYDRDGNELRQWTWSIRTQREIAAANLPVAPQEAATVSETADGITLSGGNVQVTISKTTGRISGIVNDGASIALNNGPRLASGTSTFSGISHSTSGENQVVTATYSGNLNSVTYTMRADGWMRVDYTLNITGDRSNIGITFDYPEEKVESMRWLGAGPNPVWKNRLAGTGLGVWEKAENNPVPGQDYTTDPIFRGYHRDFKWGELATSEAKIRIVSETPDLFLRVLTPANGIDPRTVQYTVPSGEISLLHGISPIGTKFFAADELGPMSEPNVATGTYSGSFWLSFGTVDPRITAVEMITPYRVRVEYNRAMNAAAFDPASYSIPGHTVHAVTADSGNAVLLDISPLEQGIINTLDVAELESATGEMLVGGRSFSLFYQRELELDLPFDELTAGISPDLSGNGLDAEIGSGASLDDARRGDGLALGGTSASRATVDLPSMSAFTLEAWINLTDGGNTWPRIISMANENVQFFFDYSGGAYNASIGLNVKGGGDWRSPANSVPAFGSWFHVAVSYDSAAAGPSFYLNGELLSTASSSTSSGTYGTGGSAIVGNRADGVRGLNGMVDDFRIYSNVLSSGDIAADAALPPTARFDEWIAARGYSGALPEGDADMNGMVDFLDYFSSVPEGQEANVFTVSTFPHAAPAFCFQVGHLVEGLRWQVETSTNLVDGSWSVLPEGNIYAWRDTGDATEYLAAPFETNAPHCFGRLVVYPN